MNTADFIAQVKLLVAQYEKGLMTYEEFVYELTVMSTHEHNR